METEIGTYGSIKRLHSNVYTNEIGYRKTSGLVESLGTLSFSLKMGFRMKASGVFTHARKSFAVTYVLYFCPYPLNFYP